MLREDIELKSHNLEEILNSKLKNNLIWDAYGFPSENGGIYTHAVELFKALKTLDVHPYLSVLPEAKKKGFFAEYDRACSAEMLLPNFFYKLKLIWPSLSYSSLRKGFRSEPWPKKTIYHGLANINLPLMMSADNSLLPVVTIHDLIPLIDKKAVSSTYYHQFKYALPRVLTLAKKIICVSEWTKHNLLDRFPFCEDKVLVIANGRSSKYSAQKKVFDNRNISLLSIGRYEKYKNLEFLVDLLRKLEKNVCLHLVTDKKGHEFMQGFAAEFIATNQLKLHSQLCKEDLERLFLATDLYVHPSLYEGYCLPVVEATSYGIPVLFKGGSAMDEIVHKNSSFKMKDFCVDSWLDVIVSLKSEAFASGFSLELKKHFYTLPSWLDSAQALKKVYNELE